MERRKLAPADTPANEEDAATLKKLETEKRRASRIDFSDVFWLLAFIFVLHQFDVIDALRFDLRVDWYAPRRSVESAWGNEEWER